MKIAFRSLTARRALFVLLVGGSWPAAASFLGSRGEAFWLLVPLWTAIGAFVLRAIPPPRSQFRSRPLKILVQVFVILFPAGFYLAMAHLLRGRVSWTELLLAVYFFAVSLEVFLLYLFQAHEALRQRLTRERGRWSAMSITFGTKLLLYAFLFPFLLVTFATHRVKIPPHDPSQEFGMPFEEVRFLSRGDHPLRLAGWFFPLEKNRGTVLACHGVGANRSDILDIIWALREAGFQVLAFDFRGHGESDGHTITYGVREREDVLGAWDYLVGRRDVDPGRILGFGVSMGASSLLLALPDLPGMRAAVCDSAFSDLATMVRRQYWFLPGAPGDALSWLTVLVGWVETGLRVGDVAPLQAIEQVRIPIFFIHGLDDPVVPAECTRRLHAAYGGTKKLRLEPGAAHGGTAGADLDRYEREVRSFYLEAVDD